MDEGWVGGYLWVAGLGLFRTGRGWVFRSPRQNELVNFFCSFSIDQRNRHMKLASKNLLINGVEKSVSIDGIKNAFR